MNVFKPEKRRLLKAEKICQESNFTMEPHSLFIILSSINKAENMDACILLCCMFFYTICLEDLSVYTKSHSINY